MSIESSLKKIGQGIAVGALGVVLSGCGVYPQVGEVVNNCNIPKGQNGHTAPMLGGLGSVGGKAEKNIDIARGAPVYGGGLDTGDNRRYYFVRAEDDGKYYATGLNLNSCQVRTFK